VAVSEYLAVDEPGIIRLITHIQQQEFNLNITAEDQPDLNEIPTFYQVGAGNFWMATLDGKVIGSIALLDIGNGNAALRKFFVQKDLRGGASLSPSHYCAYCYVGRRLNR